MNPLQTLMQNTPLFYAAMFVACVLPTYFWRGLGVAIGKKLHPESELFRWVKCVATATICAVVVRLLLYPSGDLAALPLEFRLGAFALGIISMLIFKRSVEWGLIIGVGFVFVVKSLI